MLERKKDNTSVWQYEERYNIVYKVIILCVRLSSFHISVIKKLSSVKKNPKNSPLSFLLSVINFCWRQFSLDSLNSE